MNARLERTFLKDYKPALFAIDKVLLDFDIQADFTNVLATLHIRKLVPSASALILNGEGLELIHLKIDDRTLSLEDYSVSPEELIIKTVPDAFQLTCLTKIYPEKNTELNGLYQSGKQYCTQCEAEGFRHITYFLDRPDVMALYQTKITADKKRFPVLLSNGNLLEQGEAPNGRHWVLFEDPFKKPSYLFAMVAGDFDLLSDEFCTQSGRKISLRIYVDKGEVAKAKHAMKALKEAMRWDEVHYGREYDLDLYLIVSIRDFNAGAMENKGLNIFNAQYILANPATATDDDYLNIESVIAHEYFHNWTGNRITCRDWFQLSLKEGLTIFRDQSFTEDTFSKAVARIRSVTQLRLRQFPEDASPLAHPVQPNSYLEISNFYSSTIYNKGAEVIRMIRTLIGEAFFQEGMQWYFKQYDGMAITIEDFIHAFAVVSSYDFSQFKRWYTQAGTPIVHVTDAYDSDKALYTLNFEQETPATSTEPNKEPLVIPILTALFNEEGQEIPIETPLLTLTKARETFYFKNMTKKPIPSLLRGFSAPIKLEYPYTLAQISILSEYDTDSFNRFEISQIYAHQIFKDLMTDEQATLPEKMVKSFNALLKDSLEAKGEDKYYIAELLTYPSEKLIAEKMPIVDCEAIHRVREYALTNLSEQATSNLLQVYEANNKRSQSSTLEAMADRRLKNIALFYLMLTNKEEFIQLGFRQFKEALCHNMTDLLGALRCLVDVNTSIQQEALSEFYAKWHEVPEVLDKWFGQQALSKLPDTLERVKALVHHPKFSLTNPNQVHALIGNYSRNNPALFHDKQGKSYEFLSDIVLELNVLNPYLAAAMVKPLLDWRRYDKAQQARMHKEIERILAVKNLAKGLYEVVKASV